MDPGHDRFRFRRVFGLAVVVCLPLAELSASAALPKSDRFTGTPGVSSPHDDLDIHFHNPNLANTTVKIILFDERNNEITVKIKLDKNGDGKRTVPTPNWNVVILTHPTSDAHGVVIKP